MTTTLNNGGSPTLKVLFDNLTSAERSESAAVNNLRGPYEVGQMTAFVFRPPQDNGRAVQLESLEDTGLASGEGGRQEVDFNQLGPEDLQDRAQRWYRTQLERGNISAYQKVAVVFDWSRMGAEELGSTKGQDALARTLDEMSRPSLMERAKAAVKKAFGTPQP